MKIELVEREIWDIKPQDIILETGLESGQIYDFSKSGENFTRPYIIISNNRYEKYNGFDHPVRFCRCTSVDHSFWNIPIVFPNPKSPMGFTISFVDTTEIITPDNRKIDEKKNFPKIFKVNELIVELINRIVSRDTIRDIHELETLIMDVYDYSKKIEELRYPKYPKVNQTSPADKFVGKRVIKPEDYKTYVFNHQLPEIKNYVYYFPEDQSINNNASSFVAQEEDCPDINCNAINDDFDIDDSSQEDENDIEQRDETVFDRISLKRKKAQDFDMTEALIYCADYENLEFSDFCSTYAYSENSRAVINKKYKTLKSKLSNNETLNSKSDIPMELEPVELSCPEQITDKTDIRTCTNRALYTILCDLKQFSPMTMQDKYKVNNFKRLIDLKNRVKEELRSRGITDDPDDLKSIKTQKDITSWKRDSVEEFINDTVNLADFQIVKKYNLSSIDDAKIMLAKAQFIVAQ